MTSAITTAVDEISESLSQPPRRDLPEVHAEFSDDLQGVLRTLYSRRWLFLGVLLSVVGLAVVWLILAVPQYASLAVVVLDPRKQVITNSPEVLPDLDPNSAVVDTQARVIESQIVVDKAIGKIGLATFREKFGQEIPREVAVGLVQSGLDVSRVGLTMALAIRFTDDSPTFASLAANSVAEAYIDYQSEAKVVATQDANRWLTERVEELKAELDQAEESVDQYRTRAGLLVANGASLTESEVASIGVGMNEARKALGDAEARLATYQQALRTDGSSGAAQVAASVAMQQLRDRLAGLSSQRAQFSATLGPSHPEMVQLQQQISALEAEMEMEAQRTVQQLESEVAVAKSKLNSLTAMRSTSRSQLVEDNAASVELTQLQTKAQALRLLYEDMLTRLQQTTAQESLGQINATIISPAKPALRPYSPRTGVVLVGSVAAGLALGCLTILLAQVLSTKIVRPGDIERRSNLPVLGLVPKLEAIDLKDVEGSLTPAEAVPRKPMSLYSEAFRNSRVAISSAAGGRRPLVVQITSGTLGEGKTTYSIGLAQATALDGRRVLLVDADVRRQSLTKYLNIRAEVGLMEVLSGRAAPRDAIIAPVKARHPHVLPLSIHDVGPHDKFSGTTFDSLLKSLRPAFDLIVFDSAPALIVAESIALSRKVDAVVVVAKWSSTPAPIVLKAIDELRRAGAAVVGTVLTQVNIKQVSREIYGRRHYVAMSGYYQN